MADARTLPVAPDCALPVAPDCALPGTPLAAAAGGIDACVHCGFCLQACPTYLALEDENDSPRGRLVLMRALLDGDIPADDPTTRAHLDRCLGCRACETACPSGVPYGQLLEATRATLAARRPVPLLARTILAVFAAPTLLRLAMAAGRLARATGLPARLVSLPGRLGAAMAMLASTRQPVTGGDYPAPVPTRGDAVLLEGCVMDGLLGDVNAATGRVLARNGWAMRRVEGQRCCGALHAHAGDLDTARTLAKANIAAFERRPDATIVSNSAGCGAMLKEYAHLLHDEPAWHARAQALAARVRDVSELLAAAGPAPAALAAPVTVTYDAPCHLEHAQRITAPPLRVLGAIGNCTLVPLVDSDQCCGSAGIYNLIEPDVSEAVLAPKLRHVADTGATLVATGNPGCLMQIGGGLLRRGASARAVHPILLLDRAYADEARRP